VVARRTSDRGRRAGWRADVRFAVGLLLGSGLLVLAGGDLTASIRSPWWVAIAVLQCGSVALRRVSPATALAVCWIGAVVQVVAVQEVGPQNLAVLVIVYSAACYGSLPIRVLGAVSALGGGVLAGWFMAVTVPQAEGRVTASAPFLVSLCAAILVLAWSAGVLRAITRQRVQERLEADVAAERARYAIAVEEERARIARDVHDVVAHSLTVMIAHAEGARLSAEAQLAVTPATLSTIADTGRAALSEVRGVLAGVRTGTRDSPQPSLRRLDDLIGELRRSCASVEVEETGTAAPLPPRVDVAAFRIAQEALTNAVRHGDGDEPIVVRLDWRSEMLVVQVSNALSARRTTARGGHGVIGMMERARSVGGDVTAAVDGGAFVVIAQLPYDGQEER